MLLEAKTRGVKSVRIHALIDGRDVPPLSALDYIRRLESFLSKINKDTQFDYLIASGGGRMRITMDRYDADWPMVEKGWRTHVLGKGRYFNSMEEAVKDSGLEDKDVSNISTGMIMGS